MKYTEIPQYADIAEMDRGYYTRYNGDIKVLNYGNGLMLCKNSNHDRTSDNDFYYFIDGDWSTDKEEFKLELKKRQSKVWKALYE